MVESRFFLKHWVLPLFVAVCCSIGLSSLISPASYARQNAQNGAERYVENGSNPDGRYIGPNCRQFNYNIGTLWVTRDDNTQNEEIVITGGTTSVTVRLYSTVRSCSASYRAGATNSSMGHVSQCNGWVPMTLIPQGSSRSMFNAATNRWENTRYYIPDRNKAAGHWWSDPFNGGNYIRATLNVTGLGTGNYNVCLHGTFSQDGYCRPGWCFDADRQIGFRITREYRWGLTPTSAVNSAASVNQPGQTLSWQHTIRNDGPDATNRTVTYRAQNQGSLGGGNVASWNVGSGFANGRTTSQTTSRTITQGDVGNSLCRRTVVVPRAWNNGGELASGNACRTIPYNYSLTANVTNVPEVVEAGQAIDGISGNVRNSGPTKSYPTDVRYARVIYPAGSSVSTRSGTSTDGTCAFYGAPSSRCSELRTGTGANDRSNYVFNHPNGDAGGAITSANGTYSIPSIGGTLEDNLNVGDRVCYSLLVRGYNAATGSSKNGTYYSQLQCSIVGKKPKVQVHGGNVSVGRSLSGSGNPYNTGATVQTTITNKQARSETVPAPEGSISGLWRTGVSASNTKLTADVDDPHWQVDRVYRANGDTRQTCARAQIASGNTVSIPSTSSGTILPARTVVENVNGSSGTAGMYSGPNAIIGTWNGAAGIPVWNRQSSNARWISHNLWGQNYSTPACPDPSTSGTTIPQQLALSNVYVYKLRSPIIVASDVNLNSIRLNVSGAVDNLVKFYVNGCELRSTRPTASFGDGRWQEPGWSASSQAGAEAYVTAGGAGCSVGSTGFRTGANTFEIHVLSTYSHTGLLIDQFTASATVTRAAANVFGSWAEYGILAPGEIRWMASGSGLEGGNASSLQSDWSRLTFTHAANAAPACSAIVYGCYSHGRTTLPPVASAFPVTSLTPSVGNTTTPSGLAGGTSDGRVVTTTEPTLTINAGNLGERRWAVLNAPNTHVIINGNLTYDDGPFDNINKIPQLIIIARDITINGSVSRVDAWLIAANALSTCNERGNSAPQLSSNYVSSRLVADDCDQKLTVNGPVIANKLYLRRTAGSLPATSGNPERPGEPAEVFNLRPDSYLWANARMGSQRVYVTSGLQELPPRY